jgi:hypothetical protein
MTMIMEPPGMLFLLFLDFRALRQYHLFSWGTDDINHDRAAGTEWIF